MGKAGKGEGRHRWGGVGGNKSRREGTGTGMAYKAWEGIEDTRYKNLVKRWGVVAENLGYRHTGQKGELGYGTGRHNTHVNGINKAEPPKKQWHRMEERKGARQEKAGKEPGKAGNRKVVATVHD